MTSKEINNILNEIITPEIKKRADQIEMAIIKSRGEKIFNSKGAGAGKYIRATAINQAKKANEKEVEQSLQEPETGDMKEDKLREMVKAALSKPLDEKKAKPDFLDIDKDGDKEESMKKAAQDKKSIQNEDLDLGHEDDEPHMIKGELYKIAQNAMALYKMLEPFDESNQEIDFPAWWQAKITKACTMLGSAKNYLEFELKEPQIDAMTSVMDQEGVIDENIDDIDYRNRNNIMRGVYDLAKKFKDVESFKEKWYKTYSRGPQDQDSETDEFLEKIFNSVNKSSSTIDEMSKKQIKKRGEIYDTLKSQGMSDEKAGKIATSKAMKMKEEIAKKLYEDANKIKKLEAALAKVKHQYYKTSDLSPEKEIELRKQMGDIGRELKRLRREDKTGSAGYGKPSLSQKIKEAILANLKNK